MKNFYFRLCLFLLVCACNTNDKKTAKNLHLANQNFSEGKQIYQDFCINCHMANGEGVTKVFPPLANSDYLKNNRAESIKGLKYGMSGEITVNGIKYNSIMASQGLSNEEIANVMNYITNNWGNENKSLITEEEVSKLER